MKTLAEVREILSSPHLETNYETVLADARAHKANAVAAGDEAEAKRIWCLEHAAESQQLYHKAFSRITSGQFFEGWCTLEQVELALNRLRLHGAEDWATFRLDFIDEKTVSIQSLYPYKLFLSPEIIEQEKKCNICDCVISIRNPCGHRVGEIYKGEYCCRIVTKSEFVGISFVESPVQKYSVPFDVDPITGESRDHYNYSVVRYLADRWPSPYHDWQATWTKALHPKERFGPLGRNDKCPCGSGLKYKACCLRRDGIIRPHVEFEFRYSLPVHLQTIEFSN
jgi:SEC-C motif